MIHSWCIPTTVLRTRCKLFLPGCIPIVMRLRQQTEIIVPVDALCTCHSHECVMQSSTLNPIKMRSSFRYLPLIPNSVIHMLAWCLRESRIKRCMAGSMRMSLSINAIPNASSLQNLYLLLLASIGNFPPIYYSNDCNPWTMSGFQHTPNEPCVMPRNRRNHLKTHLRMDSFSVLLFPAQLLSWNWRNSNFQMAKRLKPTKIRKKAIKCRNKVIPSL